MGLLPSAGAQLPGSPWQLDCVPKALADFGGRDPRSGRRTAQSPGVAVLGAGLGDPEPRVGVRVHAARSPEPGTNPVFSNKLAFLKLVARAGPSSTGGTARLWVLTFLQLASGIIFQNHHAVGPSTGDSHFPCVVRRAARPPPLAVEPEAALCAVAPSPPDLKDPPMS